MKIRRLLDPRLTWLILGIAIGAGGAWACWPSEAAHAYTADRNDKFAVTTARTSPTTEAVFVLDFLTGQIRGFALDRTSERFMMIYTRAVAQDFQVDPNKQARYALVSGLAQRVGRGGAAWAASYIYVAELSSGRVQAYGIPFRSQRGTIPLELVRLNNLSFAFSEPREAD